MKKYIDLFESSYKDSSNIEEVIYLLKNNGASLRDCVAVLAKGLKISLSAADTIVLNSKAWSEEKEPTLESRRKIDELIFKNTNKL